MILKNGPGLCIAILVCSLAGVTQKAPESRPIAEGEYSAVQDGEKAGAALTLDHWRMYLQPDGTFKVDVEIKTVPAPAKGEEHFTFTKAMRPLGYEWVMRQENKPESARIRCDFTNSEAQCSGKTMNGRPFSTSLAIKVPYAFMPITDEPFFDFPWAFQAMVWQAERTVNRSTSIDMITLGDGETENGTVLETGPKKPFGVFRYLGRETIEIVGQKVNAHEFEARSGEHDGEHDSAVVFFWLSNSGLLLKTTGPEVDSPGSIVLSRYEGPAL